ncbi:MAG: hypothetical protein IT288_09265 [Bdellovibrionales bacterium]|nr:hypothetical protein [Bdellovibrionales bacterium]
MPTYTFKSYFEEVVEPNLVNPEVCRVVLKEMDEIVQQRIPLAIRKFAPAKDSELNTRLRGNLGEWNGFPFVCCDNEASFWLYELCKEGYDKGCLTKSIQERAIPVARKSIAGELRDFSQTTFSLRLTFPAQEAGWKLAHLFRASPSGTTFTTLSPSARFYRNLCPMNFYLSPKPKRNDFRWVDFEGKCRGDEFAEADEFNSYIIFKVGAYYSTLWEEFVKRVGVDVDSFLVKLSQRFNQDSELETKLWIEFGEVKTANKVNPINGVGHAGAVQRTATRFWVKQVDYDELVASPTKQLVITVQGGKGKKVHPSGVYVIPNNIARQFIRGKMDDLNWQKHLDFKQASIPTELREYFHRR